MVQYRCIFTMANVTHTTQTREGLGAFSGGFWIDKKYQFTKTHPWRWVSPGKIDFVEKVDHDPVPCMACGSDNVEVDYRHHVLDTGCGRDGKQDAHCQCLECGASWFDSGEDE